MPYANTLAMISKVPSAIPFGFEGRLVTVEGDMNRGLPNFNIVGMANKTVSEARERVKSAITSSGFLFPDKKVTINLAPADLSKDGSFLDLPIALSILILSGQLLESDMKDRLFVGELSLSGQLRPVKGIINIVELAKKSGFKEVFIPIRNLPQASLIKDITVYGAESLGSLYQHLKGQIRLNTQKNLQTGLKTPNLSPNSPVLDHIHGQQLAKRALAIAIAGRHNLLISGPPGAGKTLLAKTAVNLLPALTPEEQIEITKIYSLANLKTDHAITTRPFRNPHHTASLTSIIGGSTGPGEISLAHKGILFLDELPEFSRSVLESLRQPLEDKKITISRANQKTTYPADFILIATMNPCPCGYLGDPTHTCTCTSTEIHNYQKKLSGPLLDRIDMYLEVEKVDNNSLFLPPKSTFAEHNVVKNTITESISQQSLRYKNSYTMNGNLSSFQVSTELKLTPSARKFLKSASEKLQLSARSYFKTIKVAQTIADLEKAPQIDANHLAEALTFRRRQP